MKQRDYKSELNSIIKDILASIFRDLGFKKIKPPEVDKSNCRYCMRFNK